MTHAGTAKEAARGACGPVAAECPCRTVVGPLCGIRRAEGSAFGSARGAALGQCVGKPQ